jgi:hypothetical protein
MLVGSDPDHRGSRLFYVLATAEHEAERDQEAAISSTNHIHSDWTNKVVSSEE